MASRSWLRSAGVAVTVFGCGWVLMSLEIVGGRLLSPYFGSGVWVWGSVISVFLAALSLGYFLGGFLSRRFPWNGALACVVFVAALTVLPVALWHRQAGEWFADLGLHERWGSLLAAASLFFLPSVSLGIVSPYAVRLVARQVSTVGVSAGVLYAVSTLGSFFGCLITAFYLILWMGIQKILLVSAGALGVLAAWQLAVGLATPAPGERKER